MTPKVKLTLGATLPTDTQYENVQPVVEVEAATFEEASDIALSQIKQIADKVRKNNPFTINQAKPVQRQDLETLTDISGVKVVWSPSLHKYAQGYLSGSAFSHKFVTEFPKQRILKAMAKKFGVPEEAIDSMWKTNAEASTSLGTAIHAALELYGKYKNVSMSIKGSDMDVTHKNPILAEVVKRFYTGREEEKALYEPFVALEDEKLCGFIDRLLIVDEKKKIVRVQDYKTNPNIQKEKVVLAPFKGIIENTELEAYWLQLSFYAYILAKKGWTVEGLDIFNIVPTVVEGKIEIRIDTFSHDVLDITEGLRLVRS